MSTIDDRVVKMTFDSSKFDKAIGTTLSLLETFEKTLEFKNAKTGIGKLQTAINALSGKKAANEAEEIEKSFAQISLEKVVNKFSDVQNAINNIRSKKAVDEISNVQDSIEDVDTKHVVDEFGNVQNAASRLDLSGVSQKITDMVEKSKSALAGLGEGLMSILGGLPGKLGEFALNAFDNIGNTLKQAFQNVILTPAKEGFEEYQTQMGAIQTIMANTGRDFNNRAQIAEVNAGLDELNTYADKTIYNFTEMTKNIGTFTAAGLSMEEAIPSIQGIANVAALSGSNSQQASNAMYQLSQALSTGSLKLQDWNSVVNAGMGGQVFQDALLRTAKNVFEVNGQMGELAKSGMTYQEIFDGITDGSLAFRESLADEWITSEVLAQTLQQMSIEYGKVGDERYKAAQASLLEQGYTAEEAEEILRLAKTAEESATKVRTWSQLLDTTKEALGSGWTESWRIIIGDFQEATDLFTGLSDEINGVIAAWDAGRNGVLQSWYDWGGRDALFGFKDEITGEFQNGILQNIIDAIKGWATPMVDAFEEVFNIFSDDFDKEYADVINEFGASSQEAVDARARILDETAQQFGKNSQEYKDAIERLDATFKNAVYDEEYARRNENFKEANAKLQEYEDKILKPCIDQFGADSKEYQIALKNMAADEEHKALVENVFNASKSIQDYREEYLRPYIEEFGEDSKEYQDAVFALDHSTEVLDNTFNTTTGVMDWVGQDLSALTLGIKDFTASLAPSEDMMIGLRGVFEGLFAGIDVVVHAIVDLIGLAGGVISFIRIFTDPAIEFVVQIFGSFGQILFALRDSFMYIRGAIIELFGTVNETVFGDKGFIGAINDVWRGFLGFLDLPGKLQGVTDIIKNAIYGITSVITGMIQPMITYTQRILDTKNAIVDAFNQNEHVQKFLKALENLKNKYTNIFNAIGQIIENVKNAIARIVNPAKEAKDAAEQMTGPYKGIVDIFVKIIDVLGKAAESVATWLDGAISDEATVGYLAKAADWLVASFKDVYDTVKDLVGWAGQVIDFSAVMETMLNVLSTAGGIIWNIFKNIAGILGPIITNTADWFGGIFGTIKDAVSSGDNIILGLLKGLWQGAKSIPKTIINICKSIIDGFLKFFGIRSPSTVMEKEVGENITAGISQGLSGGLGGVLATLSKVFGDIKNSITNLLAPALDVITGAFDKVKNFVAPIVGNILDFVEHIGDALGITESISGVINSIKDFFGITSEAEEGGQSFIDMIKELIDQFHVVEQATAFFNNLKVILSDLWSAVKNFASGIKDTFMESEPIKKFVEIFDNLKRDIENFDVKQRISDFLFDDEGRLKIFAEILERVNGAVEYMSTLTPEKLFNDVVNAIDNAIGSIMDKVNAFKDTFSSPRMLLINLMLGIIDTANKLREWFPSLGDALWDFYWSIKEPIDNLIHNNDFDSWTDLLESFGEKIVNWFKDIPNKIRDGFNNLVDSMVAGNENLPPHINSIVQHIGGFLDTIRQFDFDGVFGGLISKIKEIPDRIKTAFENIKNAITGSTSNMPGIDLSGVSRSVPGLGGGDNGEGLVDRLFGGQIKSLGNIVDIVKEKVKNILDKVKELPNLLSGATGGVFGKINEALTAAIDYLADGPFSKGLKLAKEVVSFITAVRSMRVPGKVSGFIKTVGTSLRLFVGSISNVTNSIADYIKKSGKAKVPTFAQKMKDLLIAIAALAAVVAVLSFIPQDKLFNGLGAVGALVALTLGMYAIGSAIDKFNSNGNFGDSMLKAVGALGAMAIVIRLLAHTVDFLADWVINSLQDWPRLLAGLGGVLAGIGIIALMMKALSRGGPDALKASVALIPTMYALKMLTKIFETIYQIIEGKDIATLAGAAAFLAGFTVVIGKLGEALGEVGEHGIGAGLAFIGLGAGITIISDALIKLNGLNWFELLVSAASLGIIIKLFSDMTNSEFTNSAKFIAAGTAMIMYASSIVIVANQLVKLNGLDLLGPTLAIDAIMGAFFVIAKFTEAVDVGVTALALIGYSYAIMVLKDSLIALAEADPEKIWTISMSLDALMGIFGAIAAWTNAIDLAITAGSMLVFSGAIWVMADGLAKLASVDSAGLQTAAIAIGALCGGFGALTFVLSLIPGSEWVLLAFSAALMGLSAAVYVIVEAFRNFVDILPLFLAQIPSIVASISIISDHVWDFVAAGAGLGVAAIGLGAFGAALLIFGSGAFVAGEGAKILAEGLTALQTFFNGGNDDMSKAGTNVVDGISEGLIEGARKIPETILGIGKAILDGFLSFFGIHSPSTLMNEMIGQNLDAGIAEGLTDGSMDIQGALGGVLGGILTSIQEGIPGILNWLQTEGWPAFQTWLFETAIPTIGTWAGMAWDAIVGFFNENWPKFVDWLQNTAIPAVQTWFFETAVPAVGGFIMGVWDAIVGFFNENWPKFVDWLQNDAIPGVQNWFFNDFIPGLQQWVTNTWDALVNFIGENGPKVIDWLFNTALPALGNFILELIGNLANWIADIFFKILGWLGEKGKEVMNWFNNTGLPSLQRWFSNLPGTLLKAIGDIGAEFAKVGLDLLNGIKQGIEDNIGIFTNAITDLGNRGLDAIKNFFGINSPSRVMRDEVGHGIGEGMVLGVIDYTDQVSSAGTSLGQTLGESIGNGLSTGLDSTNGKITDTVKDQLAKLRKEYEDADKDVKNSKSDYDYWSNEANRRSQVSDNDQDFNNWIGELYASGMSEQEVVNTINNSDMIRWVQEAYNTRDRISQELSEKEKRRNDITAKINAMQAAADMAGITVLAETPVVSKVATNQTSTAQINANATSGLAYAVLGGDSTQNDLQKVKNLLTDISGFNQDIYNKLYSINNVVKDMQDDIANMQIFMDTGNLVGAIAPSMDKALGLRQINSSRGVII